MILQGTGGAGAALRIQSCFSHLFRAHNFCKVKTIHSPILIRCSSNDESSHIALLSRHMEILDRYSKTMKENGELLLKNSQLQTDLEIAQRALKDHQREYDALLTRMTKNESTKTNGTDSCCRWCCCASL